MRPTGRLHAKILALLALFLFALSTQPAWADAVDRAYDQAARNYYELYRDTPFRDRADNWLGTIKAFEEIYRSHPGHKKAPKALFNVGHLYRSLYKWNHDPEYINQSTQAFEKFTKDYPQSRLADDAQYELAQNYQYHHKSLTKAYLEYERLLQTYPRGDFRNLAKEELKKLPKPKTIQPLPPDPKGEGKADSSADTAKAFEPDDLYQPRFGGLSEKESDRLKAKRLVSKVEYWSNPDWSRMVINLKGPVRFKYQALKADEAHGKVERVFIDIYQAYLPKRFHKKIASHDGLITQARIAQFDKETVRIVLDLASLDKIKVFHLGLPNQYKLIVDILGQGAKPGESQILANREDVKRESKLDIEVPENPPQKYDPQDKDKGKEQVSIAKAFGLKVRKIILDPGHGGRDPGASGFKIREKDLTLKIAHELKALINEKHPEIEVLMTRTTDEYLSLEARTAFANQNKGDLFVSIHLNASTKSRVGGIETYYLNLTSDPDALALAAKENATSLKGISELQDILEDLMRNTKIQESSDLAQLVQKSIYEKAEQHLKIRNLGVKQAPFFVLLGAQMPSILIEAGFLTNQAENAKLKKSHYQKELAQGIYQGLYQYMKATNTI